MGSINIFKPLFTVLSNVTNKYQQHQEKKILARYGNRTRDRRVQIDNGIHCAMRSSAHFVNLLKEIPFSDQSSKGLKTVRIP